MRLPLGEAPPTFPTQLRILAPGLCSAIAVGTSIATFVWRDWIEIVFHVDPDQGSGAFEWVVATALLGVGVAGAVVAYVERRRLATGSGARGVR